jgi:hypothetical protein
MSIYILLWILISLASLTYDLYHNLKQTSGHTERQKILNGLSVAFPIALMFLAYSFDTDDRDVENGLLNVRYPVVFCAFPPLIRSLHLHFLGLFLFKCNELAVVLCVLAPVDTRSIAGGVANVEVFILLLALIFMVSFSLPSFPVTGHNCLAFTQHEVPHVVSF